MVRKLALLTLIVLLVGTACLGRPSDEPAVVTTSKDLAEMVTIEAPPMPIPLVDEVEPTPPPSPEPMPEVADTAVSTGGDEAVVEGIPVNEIVLRQFFLDKVVPAELIRGEREDGSMYFAVRTTDGDSPSFDTGEMDVDYESEVATIATVEVQGGRLTASAYKTDPPCYSVIRIIGPENIVDLDECYDREDEILALAISTTK